MSFWDFCHEHWFIAFCGMFLVVHLLDNILRVIAGAIRRPTKEIVTRQVEPQRKLWFRTGNGTSVYVDGNEIYLSTDEVNWTRLGENAQ